jgi:bacillithiol biosynthesis deacetylase BshB1
MVDILAFGAHPDDIEFGCGGILAKMAAENKSIVMVDLTLGDKGTKGTPSIRKQEGENASCLIGAQRLFLDFLDCEIIDSYEGRLKLVEVIRTYKPKLVLAPLWKGEQTHPDHIACGIMARYACRYARFGKILPEIPLHRPEGILHYVHLNCETADFLIDISPEVTIWQEMMSCHKSQLENFNYMDWQLRQASKLGLLIDKKYAQGLVKGNPIEVHDLFAIIKGTREI